VHAVVGIREINALGCGPGGSSVAGAALPERVAEQVWLRDNMVDRG
jgi:hypothetical protein